MRRFQPAATFGPLSACSGLYRQPYQRQEVGFCPKGDIAAWQQVPSLNHIIGASEQRGRHGEA
jgi:hypothetical protein